MIESVPLHVVLELMRDLDIVSFCHRLPLRIEKITTNVDTSKNNNPNPLRGFLLTTRFGLTIIWPNPCQRHLWLALSPSAPLTARSCLWSLCTLLRAPPLATPRMAHIYPDAKLFLTRLPRSLQLALLV